jgi:hypothetical protein
LTSNELETFSVANILDPSRVKWRSGDCGESNAKDTENSDGFHCCVENTSKMLRLNERVEIGVLKE